MSALHAYWAWVGGNIGAMPLQSVIVAVVTIVFRKPAAKLWRQMVGERAGIEDVRRAAAAAHRIAADLHERMTGEAHPDAPEKGESNDRPAGSAGDHRGPVPRARGDAR